MGELSSCKDCGQRILWVGTTNGKRMPLDHPAERRWVIDSAKMVAIQRNVYVCHLETCLKRR
jgi:hypothetical protein